MRRMRLPSFGSPSPIAPGARIRVFLLADAACRRIDAAPPHQPPLIGSASAAAYHRLADRLDNGCGHDQSARERLSAIYEAFRQAKVDFVLNAIDDDVEFISYSPIEVFPFLGHHRGKAAMAEVLKSGYAQFEFIAYQPVFTVCEGDDAAVIIFARFIQRKTGRSISTMIAHFLRFRNGRIVELREFMDSFHTVKQLLGRELDLEEH